MFNQLFTILLSIFVELFLFIASGLLHLEAAENSWTILYKYLRKCKLHLSWSSQTS